MYHNRHQYMDEDQLTYQKQYMHEHELARNTSLQPSHIAELKGLGHHSQHMPTDVHKAMAMHTTISNSHDDSFRKRSVREGFGIGNAVHKNSYHDKERIPSVIGGINHPCPVGQKAQSWGSVASAKNPPCVSSSPSYGSFHMQEHRQHGAHEFNDVYHKHNLKNQRLDSFRRRERMRNRKEEDFYSMGRM